MYLLIFSVFFLHQILPPWNIRLQLDFHIDHKQIKEIPGKIRQLRDYYIYFECSIYFWCTGLQIFSGKFNKYYSNLNVIFAFVFISTHYIVHTYTIWYSIFRYIFSHILIRWFYNLFLSNTCTNTCTNNALCWPPSKGLRF